MIETVTFIIGETLVWHHYFVHQFVNFLTVTFLRHNASFILSCFLILFLHRQLSLIVYKIYICFIIPSGFSATLILQIVFTSFWGHIVSKIVYLLLANYKFGIMHVWGCFSLNIDSKKQYNYHFEKNSLYMDCQN